jgi:signal transduction histidine kinase
VAVAVGAVHLRTRARRDTAALRHGPAAQRRPDHEPRPELARELHDVLAHHISLINVQADVALQLIDEKPDQARPALTEIKTASGEALRELRAALDLLRRGDAGPKHPSPRLDDLERLVDTVTASGLNVRFETTEAPTGPIPDAVGIAAYRIVQEALTNISRHAHAQRAVVRLSREGDDLIVEIVDDGVGGAAPPGTGITGMRDRAVELGGDLYAGPRPGGGFGVVARLPLGAA